MNRKILHNADEVIVVENLTKKFGNFTAVDAISFEVKRGEIFGFLGANGAGKTTAMRMLCGLSIPSGGKGMVAGYDIAHEQEKIKKNISTCYLIDRIVCIVFQLLHQFHALTTIVFLHLKLFVPNQNIL